ncbi:ABC transporter ATP-binding protein [Propionivibrio dicarboxylicus]|uniref:Branched-chain amino acid transport system ATP-binding protein n=1 Tax=Propionivibrio dicarboxylicus TaxID=83767 RepID=A0A1G8CVR7_9RHOO|nr:ABC transporter ATP-binding protein [Propionivibrio dicarboxylicus]SDH49323.1 branched-chain amino acid transport system ATP-binding protein [Propionivibrio dicarboxylicus]
MLSIRNLSVHYGGIHALRGISLDVPAGKIVTLIGANGAGKSTTLNSIMGLVKAGSGSVSWNGEEMLGRQTKRIVESGIVLVPEGRRVFPNLTVDENLTLGAFARHDKAAIEADREHVFKLFPRLKERHKQKAGTFSGGEQQMLAVGRALMSRPTVLMMDEPSLGLAPLFVGMIFDIIRQINAEGVTVLLVEQNAKAALDVADTGYVMETGSISFSGTGKDLLADDRVRKAYLGEG